MSLNDEERAIIVAREIEKARQFMVEAEGCAQMKFWSTSANRLYYALFHAVSALLIRDRHQVGSHKGVVALFGQHYVRTNIMTTDEARLYSRLQSLREKADYNCLVETSEEEILPMIEPVKEMIEKIGGLLASSSDGIRQ
ncbi:MAG: HEPN domain-containing protein [Bacteroidales bacterium]|nr:HEPN domain-containing protein [Bacteroidales bacterium]